MATKSKTAVRSVAFEVEELQAEITALGKTAVTKRKEGKNYQSELNDIKALGDRLRKITKRI